MTVMVDNDSIRAVTTGTLVTRATAALPASTDEALFTISGGRIILVALVGEVTTVIQTQACNAKLKFNPTATGSDVDLCAVLNISADAVGTLYGITGTLADAMVGDTNLLISEEGVLATPLVLSEGDIELDCSATNTGSVAWDMIYVALDSGATVAAA